MFITINKKCLSCYIKHNVIHMVDGNAYVDFDNLIIVEMSYSNFDIDDHISCDSCNCSTCDAIYLCA